MLLGKCLKCDNPITDTDLKTGRGAQLGTRYLCPQCAPEVGSLTVSTPAMGAEPVSGPPSTVPPPTNSPGVPAAVRFDEAAVPISQSPFFKDTDEQASRLAAEAGPPLQPASSVKAPKAPQEGTPRRRSSGRLTSRRPQPYAAAAMRSRTGTFAVVGFLVLSIATALCLYLVFFRDRPAQDRQAERKPETPVAPATPPSEPPKVEERKAPGDTPPSLPTAPTTPPPVPGEKPPATKDAAHQVLQAGGQRTPVFPPNDSWRYLAGSDAPDDWAEADFNDAAWIIGRAGFGYGDNDDKTVLDMRGKYTCVYIRHAVDRDAVQQASELGLMIRYDDGFIAYLNGKEVLRVNVQEGRGAGAKGIRNHETRDFEYFPIKGWKVLLRPRNVIAIEGHNVKPSSSDFTLDPYLVVTRDAAPEPTPAEAP